jgi:hypothetical protein
MSIAAIASADKTSATARANHIDMRASSIRVLGGKQIQLGSLRRSSKWCSGSI